jgi:hypothetical protein
MSPRPPCINHLGWPSFLDQVLPIHAALAGMQVVRVRRRLVAVMALAVLVNLVGPASALLVRSRLRAPIRDRLYFGVCHANNPPIPPVPSLGWWSQGVITLCGEAPRTATRVSAVADRRRRRRGRQRSFPSPGGFSWIQRLHLGFGPNCVAERSATRIGPGQDAVEAGLRRPRARLCQSDRTPK